MDLSAGEGERVIWNPGHWLVEMRPRVSLWWHSLPDICLALNNSRDSGWRVMATGSADIAARAKVSDSGGHFPRPSTPSHPLPPPTAPLHLSPALSFPSLACQYASICLMGPSEELTADMLVSLFPPAILLELASVISHATDKQLRPQHLSNPLSSPPHHSLSSRADKGEASAHC